MFKICIRDSKNEIFSLNVEKTYNIKKIKDMIKEYKQIKNEIILAYNGQPLDDDDTLESSDVGPGCTMQYAEMFKAGVDLGVDMADISNKRGLVEANFSNEAAKWNILINGLNVSGICENNNCEAYNKEVDCHIGMGTFDILRDGDRIKCPMCSNEFDPTTCTFSKCQYKLEGKKKQNGKTTEVRTDWKRVEKDYEYYDPNKSGIVRWLMLIIETKPL